MGAHRASRVWSQYALTVVLCLSCTIGGVRCSAGERRQLSGAQRPGRRCARAGSRHDQPTAHLLRARDACTIFSLREARDTSGTFEFHLFDYYVGVLLGSQHGHEPPPLAVVRVVRGRGKGGPGQGRIPAWGRRRFPRLERDAGAAAQPEACLRHSATGAAALTYDVVGATAAAAVGQVASAALA
jgi:hypothetical protein